MNESERPRAPRSRAEPPAAAGAPGTPLQRLYRAVLGGGLALLVVGWFALGGGDGLGSRDGGHYVEGVVGTPGRINPLFVNRDTPAADVAQLVFAGLTRLGPDGTPLPDLASRWEVTPDGRTYTFHLRPGLSWHDGRPLTAADVAFTVRQVQTTGFQGPIRLSAAWAGVDVLTPDARTVIFRLPTRSAAFLSTATLGIVPEHLLGGLGVAELLLAPFNDAPVGAGPYRLAERSGGRFLLRRNPAYHGGTPRIDTIELRLYADDAALLAAIARGEVAGALLRGPTAAPGVAEAADAVAGRRSETLTESGYTALYFNNQLPLLADPALRRALSLAIDRARLVARAGVHGVPGGGPFVPGTWVTDAIGAPVEAADPAAVDAAFDDAGWFRGADGFRRKGSDPLRLSLHADDTRSAVARLVQDMLLDQGVQVDLTVLPGATLLRDHIQPRAFELLIFGWTTGLDPDPFGAWHTSQISRGGGNIAGFHDPDSDRLLEEARLTLDTEERRERYRDFDARFRDLAPAAVLYYPQVRYLRPADLAGAVPGVLVRPALRFAEVHTWHLD